MIQYFSTIRSVFIAEGLKSILMSYIYNYLASLLCPTAEPIRSNFFVVTHMARGELNLLNRKIWEMFCL